MGLCQDRSRKAVMIDDGSRKIIANVIYQPKGSFLYLYYSRIIYVTSDVEFKLFKLLEITRIILSYYKHL